MLNDEDFEHLLDPEYILNDEEIIRLAQQIQIPLSTDAKSFTANEFILERENDKTTRLISLNENDQEKVFENQCKLCQVFCRVDGILISIPFSYLDEHRRLIRNMGI